LCVALRDEGSSENQPRRNEEHEDISYSILVFCLRVLRFFVVDFLTFLKSPTAA
jgi:hypothetical protein